MAYNIHGLFNIKAIPVEEKEWYDLTQIYANWWYLLINSFVGET